jgi:predicted SprT family Zn-dependent metalloprotease
MPGRSASAPPSPAAIRRALLRLARLWEAPLIRTVSVEQRPCLRTTLGRYRPRTRTVELSPRAWASPEWPEILAHEAAHAAAGENPAARGQPPHGPEWRRLMALAGYPEARGARWRGCLPSARAPGGPKPASARYLHTCTVCDFHRTARRPMRAWRCAACVAAGLSGELEITRKEASR